MFGSISLAAAKFHRHHHLPVGVFPPLPLTVKSKMQMGASRNLEQKMGLSLHLADSKSECPGYPPIFFRGGGGFQMTGALTNIYMQ